MILDVYGWVWVTVGDGVQLKQCQESAEALETGWSGEARAQGAGCDVGTCGPPGGCVLSRAVARFGLEVRGIGRPCGLRVSLCEWSLEP